MREVKTYLNQFQGTCFGKSVSIGDPVKYEAAIKRNIYRVIVGEEGAKLVAKRKDSQAYHDDTGFSGLLMANLVFPFDPDKLDAKTAAKNRQTMAHEMTHHIEYIYGVKDGEKPRSERNTNYQDSVVNNLKQLAQTEELLKTGKSNIADELSRWGNVETELRNLEKGSSAGNFPPDANLEEMTGFNARFDKIEAVYLSGACGEDLKKMSELYRLLPRIKQVLEVKPLTVKLGEEFGAEAIAENKDGGFLQIPAELKPKFTWTLPDGRKTNQNPFVYKADREGTFTIPVELTVFFDNKDFTVASGEMLVTVEPNEENPMDSAKTSVVAPKEVLATEIFDVKANIPARFQGKVARTEWSPNSCAVQPGNLSPKLQFRNPYGGKVEQNQVILNLFDAANNRLDSVYVPVTVKPVAFGGSASDIWEGGSHSGGVNLKRKEAVRKRIDKGKEINSAQVNASIEVNWEGFSHPQSLEAIQKELLKRKGNDVNKTISPITIGGWQGFILETNGVQQGFTGSGFVDAGYPNAIASGFGYAVKGCISFEFSYSAGGSGIMLGNETGFGNPKFAWWNDTPFLVSQTRAAMNEAKAILTGLKIVPDGSIVKTPYKGPKLDGSDSPTVKLIVSPDTKKLKKGETVEVRAVVENAQAEDLPLKYEWTGEYTGTGESVKFTAGKPGKQALSVNVNGVGTASIEFEIMELKAEIKQTTSTATTKIEVGVPVTFTAQLTSGGTVVKGNYVYRWQPSTDAKFAPAEGATGQTKAVFDKPGRVKVWVQILEKKGTVLETIAESEQIEIEVVPRPPTTAEITKTKIAEKLAQAKEIIKKGFLDEAIALVDEVIKINPKTAEAVQLSKKWKADRTKIKTQLNKVRALIDKQMFPEASNEMVVAVNLHHLYRPVLELEKELKDKWRIHDSALNEAVGQVRMANEAKDFKKALQLATDIRKKFRLVSGTEQTLKSYEDWARTHEAEKNRQREVLKQGEEKYNAFDYEGAIKDFDVLFQNFNIYWGIYDSETKYYENLRNEAIRRRDRINQLMPSVKQAVENTKFDKRQLETALKNAEEILQLQPPNADAQKYKTVITDRLARGEKGMKADEALKKANALYDEKKFAEAVKEYDKVIKTDPNIPEAFRRRASSKRNLGDFKGALADYDKAIELDARNPQSYTGRGMTKTSLGNTIGAIADFDNAIRLNPKYPLAFNERGIAKYKNQDWSGALADFSEAVRQEPSNAVFINNRGAAKEQLGDLRGAIADYEKSLQFDPNYELAKNNLIRIKEKMAAQQAPTQTQTTQTPVRTAPEKEIEILNVGNIYAVGNQPTKLTQFTITQPFVITYISTYHWNSARGVSQPGNIGIYNEKGEKFGPWNAKGLPGQGGVPNAVWEIRPNVTIPAGTYTIFVSLTETWSQNAQSGGRGFAVIKGYPAGGKITTTQAPATQKQTTPKQTGNNVTAVFENRSNENIHIFAEGDTFGPGNRIAPGERREVQVKMTADGRIKFIAGRDGKVITTKIWTGDPSDTNRYPRVIFDGTQLIITTGLR